MTDVILSIQQRSSICFTAYLVEAPNTVNQHTHGSVQKQTKTEAMNAAYRMAHQKSLTISHIFDEDEGRSLPVHKYKLNDTVWLKSEFNKIPVEGSVTSLELHFEGIPRYFVWFGEAGNYLFLEDQLTEQAISAD